MVGWCSMGTFNDPCDSEGMGIRPKKRPKRVSGDFICFFDHGGKKPSGYLTNSSPWGKDGPNRNRGLPMKKNKHGDFILIYWCVLRHGWDWRLLGWLLIDIMDHSHGSFSLWYINLVGGDWNHGILWLSRNSWEWNVMIPVDSYFSEG